MECLLQFKFIRIPVLKHTIFDIGKGDQETEMLRKLRMGLVLRHSSLIDLVISLPGSFQPLG